jgi:DNA primase
LSEVFFEHLGADVNLATLDGKARLAERCKPLLAKIPDGAYADLMQQRLQELTGVGMQRAGAPAAPRPSRTTHAARPSLVRQAIALLLQQPGIASGLDADSLPAADALPGLDLLHALVAQVQARPDISTAALLEDLHEHPHAAALQRLAAQDLPGDTELWRTEFLDAIEQLARQALQQRIDALAEKQRQHGLDAFELEELRALLQQRAAG